MNKLKLSVNFYVVFVVLMLFSAYPYVFYLLLGLPEQSVMNLIFFGLAAIVYVCTCLKRNETLPSVVENSLCLQIFGWIFFCVYHNDTSYLTRIFFLVFTFLCLAILCKTKSIYKFGFFYNHIILIMSVLGVIAFVLIYIGALDTLIIVDRNGIPVSFYGITCSNAVYGNMIRVAGFFDEPGALASWGIFILVINKLVFDNKVLEISLIISLFFTFSAAYFVLLPIYLILFYIQNIKKSFLILAVVFPLVLLGFKVLSSNESFLWMTTERFEGGEIRSKRTDYSDVASRIFKTSVLMGVGSRALGEYYESVNDNPFEILAKDGVVGYIIAYFPLLLLCLKYRKKDVIFCTIILFICYQQRPFHINEMHYFMMYFYITIVALKHRGSSSEDTILNSLTKAKV